MALQIKMISPKIGAGTTADGNVEIHAIDDAVGIVVTLEINSSVWKQALTNFGRLKGVGIATPAGLSVVHSDNDNAS